MSAEIFLALVVAGFLGGLGAGHLLERRRRATAVASLVEPIGSSLERVESRLQEIEAARREAYGGITQQMRSMMESQELLRGETAALGRALRNPGVRGRWGELQLRRVVEMAGLVAQCDFVEQPALSAGGGALRPDLVVRLPGGRSVAVDAKVPLDSYIEATAATDEKAVRAGLADHARRLRAHVASLSSREYWSRLPGSPEFVVAFLPADPLLAAAIEADPSLMDFAVASDVLLATPATLIALLRAVAHGWRQSALADNAREVCEVGRELHHRLGALADHLGAVGRSLDRAVEAYNRSVGSFETRVTVSARRLAQLGAADEPLDAPQAVTAVARTPRPPDAAA
ncbi:MAG TPA: DNA recombination protein RmuC [Acidimicrobiales bacterium]|nr:DNA recombination protein RmuC [Acidimicrobiales bacterium]